jgi:hypothetical protein
MGQGVARLRRTFELEDLIERSHEFDPQTGATCDEQKHTWFWPNGVYLQFRYLERDRTRYQGHQPSFWLAIQRRLTKNAVAAAFLASLLRKPPKTARIRQPTRAFSLCI